MMHSSFASRAFALFSILSVVVQGQSCYYPDGSESGDTPCQSGDGLTVFCCPSGSKCIASPGPVCQTSNGGYLRGSCTAQDWSSDTSSACPKFCLATITDNEMERCGSPSNTFCCGYDSSKDLCDCKTQNNTFPLNAYEPIQVVSSMTLRPSFTSEAPTPSSSPVSSPTAVSETPGAQTTGGNSPTNSPHSTLTPPSSSSLSTGAKVGLGVGIPVAVALLAIIGWLIWRQRKKNSAPQVSELHGQGQHPQYSPYPVEQKPEWMQNAGTYGQNTYYAKSTPTPYEMNGSAPPLPYGAQGPPPPVHEMPTQQK